MFVRDIEHLNAVVDSMKPGYFLKLMDHDFGRLWPRPHVLRKDDYLSDQERAEKWAELFEVTITKMLDPPCLIIHRPAVKVQARPEVEYLGSYELGDEYAVFSGRRR